MRGYKNLTISLLVLALMAPTALEAVRPKKLGSCKRVNKFRPTKGSSTASILSSRGYRAQEHYVRVQHEQYTLSLVRATNPLIKGGKSSKEPILFIHGLMSNANSWILANNKVRPRNYSDHDASSMSVEQLQDLLKGDQGAGSLVFTALNFGHEVWLLNRRATLDSRMAHAYHGKPSPRGQFYFDADDEYEEELASERSFGASKYWNFTFDEQALYDVPGTIDYILKTSNKEKLVVVGHSAGTTLTLMALTEKPELADKISKALLWAPVLDMGHGIIPGFFDKINLAALPITSKLRAPWPAEFTIPITQISFYVVCSNKLLRPLICDRRIDYAMGKGASQLRVEHLRPQNYWADTGAISEKTQYYQAYKKSTMHHFDFMDPVMNMKAYNQSQPPIYDISRIKLETMSLWFGNTDQLSRLDNFELARKRFRVPFTKKIIGNSKDKVLFNHMAFLLHMDVDKHLILPSLKTIESK